MFVFETLEQFVHFPLKMSEELHPPIGSLLYLYLPHRNIIVQILILSVMILVW